MMKPISSEQLDKALTLVNDLLVFKDSEPYHLIVCGGSALIALQLVPRTTKDVDILAMENSGELIAPAPIPQNLIEVASDVQKSLGLPDEWLNNGPSSNEGGLFQMGLPKGLQKRLVRKEYGEKLTISFISRLDQVYFKLWASVDRGGYHIEDLMALTPTANELFDAACWTMEKDVSEGYLMVLKDFLKAIGFEDVALKLA